jgi:hypothetical protein
VPLSPGSWSSVFGASGTASAEATAGFADTLRNVANVGMTFGGGCFAGHGAYVSSGTATFYLVRYVINP